MVSRRSPIAMHSGPQTGDGSRSFGSSTTTTSCLCLTRFPPPLAFCLLRAFAALDGLTGHQMAQGFLIPAGPDWQHQKLYVLQLDGTGLHAIPVDSEGYSCGSWSPDGRRVVASQGDSARSLVVAFEVVTGIREVLASSDSTELGCPDWSPDGKTVLISVYHGTIAQREAADRADADLALLDVSSRRFRALTHGPGVNNHGRWDHTGQWIVYQCTPNSSAGRDTTARRRFFTSLEICAIRPDGTGRRQLTNNDYFDAHPSW